MDNRGRGGRGGRGGSAAGGGGDRGRGGGDRGRGRGGLDRGGSERGGSPSRGGYDRGGSDRGGSPSHGGYDRGGYDRGGADRGGYNRGGFDRGGSERGAYNRGGSDRGGSDRGSNNRGGFDRGGYGGRGGFQDRGGRGGGMPRGGGGGGGVGRQVVEPEVFKGSSGTIPPRDGSVDTIEDDINKNLSKNAQSDQEADINAALGKLGLQAGGGSSLCFPQRPGFATRGTPITLWANYFGLTSTRLDRKIFRYTVNFGKQDDLVVGKKRSRLIQQLLSDGGPLHSITNQLATDYKQNLLSTEELSDDQLSAQIRYRHEDEDHAAPQAPTYTIILTPNSSLLMSELIDYLTSTDVSTAVANKEAFTQALNIIVGHWPKGCSDILSVGGNKHYALKVGSKPAPNNFADEPGNLGGGLWAWRGYFVSVRNATARLLLNVQVKHAALFDTSMLEDICNMWCLDQGFEIINVKRNNGVMTRLGRFLKGVRVEARHLPSKRTKDSDPVYRVKTVFGLASSSDGEREPHPPIVPRPGANASEVKFYLAPDARADIEGVEKGGYITVQKFFASRYPNFEIKAGLPVVNVGNPRKPVYLPMSVCKVTPGNAVRTMLSPNQTTSMINFAVRRPHENALSIISNGRLTLGLGTSAALSSFGLKVTPDLITVQGRILSAPKIVYKNRPVHPRDGSWNMARTEFHTSKTLPKWCVLWVRSDAEVLKPSGPKVAFANWHELMHTVELFQQELENCGMDAQQLDRNLGSEGRTTDLEQLKLRLAHIAEEGVGLVLVVLPANIKDVYEVVKTAGEVVHGMHTVHVIGDKFLGRNQSKNNNAQYWANVALKINLKLGGRNQALETDKMHIIKDGKTMVVGLDVTHPSPGSKDTAPSIAAMVASVDRNLGQWPAVLRRQTLSGKEMMDNIGEMLKSRLDLWQKENKFLPDNILVYRDGVSEGQYEQVLDKELTMFQTTCGDLYTAKQTADGIPRFTFVIVGKRHHTRFYPTTDAPGQYSRSGNTPNGTVVDRDVTEARNWDFFLQAHTALQGTARPAHYFVVYDRIFREAYKTKPFPAGMQNCADVLEDLTHNMSYMFGRATKAVSICPPAYYADLACERARVYLRDEFAPSDAGSTTGGGAPSNQVTQENKSVNVHEKLKDSMFYI